MEQLRIYTLKDEATATSYLETHWQRHLQSLPKFSIHVQQVFRENDQQKNRVVALVSCAEDQDLDALNQAYMQSEAFKQDMAGFDMSAILKVETLNLKQYSF